MTRRTSITVYREIKRLGLLSKQRYKAYRALFHYGPATASELNQKLCLRGEADTSTIKSLHKRLSDLVRLDVAYEVRERKCGVTGKVVIEFDVNGCMPTDNMERRVSKLEAARARIAVLEAEVTRLKDQRNEAGVEDCARKRQLLLLR